MDCAQEIGVSVRTLEEVGETQYQQFKKADRDLTVDLKEPIKENRLGTPPPLLKPQCKYYIQS